MKANPKLTFKEKVLMFIFLILLVAIHLDPSFGEDLKKLSLNHMAPNLQVYPNKPPKKNKSFEQEGIPHNATEFSGENSTIRFLTPNLSSPELYNLCKQKDPNRLPPRVLVEMNKMKKGGAYTLFFETLKMGCDQNLSGEEIKENLINTFRVGIKLQNEKYDLLQDKKINYAPASKFIYFSGEY